MIFLEVILGIIVVFIWIIGNLFSKPPQCKAWTENGQCEITTEHNSGYCEVHRQEKSQAIQAVSKGEKITGVYFISDGNAVKIGYSKNCLSRIKSHQTSNSSVLKIFFIIDCRDDVEYAKFLEKAIHRNWQHKRTTGEWFTLNERELLSIKVNYKNYE